MWGEGIDHSLHQAPQNDCLAGRGCTLASFKSRDCVADLVDGVVEAPGERVLVAAAVLECFPGEEDVEDTFVRLSLSFRLLRRLWLLVTILTLFD